MPVLPSFKLRAKEGGAGISHIPNRAATPKIRPSILCGAGLLCYGYPDDTFLLRLAEELRERGFPLEQPQEG